MAKKDEINNPELVSSEPTSTQVPRAKRNVRFDDSNGGPAGTTTENASRTTSAMTSPSSGEFEDGEAAEKDASELPPLQQDSSRLGSIVQEGPDDENTSIPGMIHRGISMPEPRIHKGAEYEKVGDHGVCKMHKFSLYETSTRYFIVGADDMDRRFRILKIDRTAERGNLSIAEDEIVYTKQEMSELLNAIDDGNKVTGGMRLKCSTWGLLGFIRFTGPQYMLLITKRSQVAMIGGHFVYQVDGTELVPLTPSSNSRFKPDAKNPEEARFLQILSNLDLTRSFYFSYSYNITRTLQRNIIIERDAVARGSPCPRPQDHNWMFVWNDYLLKPAVAVLKNTYDWCMPVMHGYVDQAVLPIYGRTAYITIIARRSRYFAGARFLKRGANDMGYVANDVETEQIVSEVLTTSFHAPGPRLFSNPLYTSYVQHRGSIPLYWTQDNTGVTPKPPIELNLVDPFYSAAALHFDNMFERYGAPLYVLNLVKAKERTPRESKLLKEFTNAIHYLNQFLPEGKRIVHKAWDMSRASKSRDQDVIGTLEGIAEEIVTMTGFFHNGDGKTSIATVQNGVARTNCIDCLDRTNAAQFVIGKRALGHQLRALGIITDTQAVAYDTDAINLFTHMYHDHGDTIAIQYGGSQLVNTMETYRKINQWTSHSRDMVESFKRYYNNSFLDGQRQEAYNLFLGNYIFAQGQPMLWDLATDYYLHHSNPRTWKQKFRRNYINWYTPAHIAHREPPPPLPKAESSRLEYFDDYWLEYYKPLAVSSLQKIFSYPGKMNSTLRYLPSRSTPEGGRYDLSPFKVRTDVDQDVPEKKRSLRTATHLDPGSAQLATGHSPTASTADDDDASSIRSGVTKRMSLQRWLQPITEREARLGSSHSSKTAIVPETLPQIQEKPTKVEKSRATQSTFTQVVAESLNPTVSVMEEDDYRRWVEHHLQMPLVISNESEAAEGEDAGEYAAYVNGDSWGQGFGVDGMAVMLGGTREVELQLEGVGIDVDHEELGDFEDFLAVAESENPLMVSEGDGAKKRYKAYRKWLMGKSLFKQQPVQ